MKTCNDVTALVGELQLSRSQMYRWRDKALGRIAVPSPKTAAQIQEKKEEQQKRRIAELERLVARQALDLDFFRGCLAAHRGKSPEAHTDFRDAVYRQIRQVDGQQGEMTIERMCTLAAVSRASYYRFYAPEPDADEEESRLRDAIQRAVLAPE